MIREITCAVSLCALIAPVADAIEPGAETLWYGERGRARLFHAAAALVQRKRIPSPRNVLPSAKIPQQLRAARLPH